MDDASPAMSSSSFPTTCGMLALRIVNTPLRRRHRSAVGQIGSAGCQRDVDVVAAEVDRAGGVAHRRNPSGDVEARVGDVDMAEHLVGG